MTGARLRQQIRYRDRSPTACPGIPRLLDSRVVRVIFLLLLAVGCTAAPPVRVEDEAFDVLQQVRAAIGADALFPIVQ